MHSGSYSAQGQGKISLSGSLDSTPRTPMCSSKQVTRFSESATWRLSDFVTFIENISVPV